MYTTHQKQREQFFISRPSARPPLPFNPCLAPSVELRISESMFIGAFFYCFYSRTSPQMQTELRLTPDPMTHSTSTMKRLPMRKPEGRMWDFHAVVPGKSMPIVFREILAQGVKLWRWKQTRAFTGRWSWLKTPSRDIVDNRKIPVATYHINQDLVRDFQVPLSLLVTLCF